MILRHFYQFSSTSWQGLVVLQGLFWLTAHSQFLKNPRNTDVIQGGNVTMECQISPSIIDSETIMFWIVKNRPVSTGDTSTDSRYQIEINREQGIYKLKIFNANYSSDNGIVYCYLTCKTGKFSSEEAKLTILIPPGQPTINVIPQRVVQEGEKMVFNCTSVGGNPAPNISWYRNDVLLNSTYEAGANKDQPTSSELILHPVKKEDNQAVFHCQVSSRALIGNPLVISSNTLNVRYYPRVTVGPSNPMRLEQGTTAIIVCSIDSNPGVSTVQWRRNGQLLPYTSPSLSFTTQNLVNKTDAGNYTCSANNGINGEHTGSLILDVLYGPEVIVSYAKMTINESGSIDVKCVADANPPVTNIQWTKVGESFLSRGDNLHLTDLKRYDAGTFTCSAENQLMTSSNSQPLIRTGKADVNIIVQYPSGKAIIVPSNPKALLGRPLSLQCSASQPGIPPPVYHWTRFDGKPISRSLEGFLNFSEISWLDNGQYKCQAINILGGGEPAITMLEVNEPARLVNELPESIVLKEHDKDKYISCIARGKPAPYMRWFKDGQEISRGNHMYSVRLSQQMVDTYANQVESLLEFKGPDRGLFSTISLEDRGNFTCHVSNPFNNGVSTSVIVTVQYPPVIKKTGNVTAADFGNIANLECIVMANPRAMVSWGRRGEKIVNNTMRYVMREYDIDSETFRNVLSIKEVRTEDLGDYVCFSINILGNMSFTVNLREKSAPETPRNLILVNTTYSSAFLTWDPGFDGGDPQWFFFELINENGTIKKVDVPENATSFEIKDLDSSANYKVRLYAQNKISKSDVSGEVQIRTKDLPYGEGDIPKPYRITYDKEDHSLVFDILNGRTHNLVDYNKLCAKVILTFNKDDNIDEFPYDGCLAILRLPGQEKYFVKLYNIDPNTVITKAQMMFCYRLNDFSPYVCGASEAFILGNQNTVRQSSELPLEILIPVVVVGGLVLLVVIVILAVVFYRRKKKPAAPNNNKKDYELETSHARPRGPGPFYPDGISNHALDNHIDLDDPIIGGVYTTNSSGLPPPYTSIPDSYLNNGGLYPDSERGRKRNKSDSMDNSPDLWVKSNGHTPMDQPWDSEVSLRNGYPSHTNYNDYDEDVMNRQNRNNFVLADSPYIEVSGLPDPYELDEEKSPTSNISFDDSIESGYSTPNSKAGRRVIREIIV